LFAAHRRLLKPYFSIKRSIIIRSSKNINISSKIPKRISITIYDRGAVAWETLLARSGRAGGRRRRRRRLSRWRWRRKRRRRRRWRRNITRRKGGDFRWLQGKIISQTTYTPPRPSCSIIGSVHDDDVVLLSLLKYRGAHTTTYNIIYARVCIIDICCTGCHRVIVTVRPLCCN